MRLDPAAFPWAELTDEGMRAVADVVTLLARKHTGPITLHCNEGGVRGMEYGHAVRGANLGTLHKAVDSHMSRY